MNNTLAQFRDAIRRTGLEPPDVIEPGKLHRFPGIGKGNGNTAGWCILFDDGFGGCFGDWSSGLSENWQAKREKPFSQSERAEFKRRVEKAQKHAEAQCQQEYANAAKNAVEIWNTAEPANNEHPYLVRKGIKACGSRVYKEALVIPLRRGGELWSLQFIDAEGHKYFLNGGRVQGCYFSIGKPEDVLCISEGYATAASIHEATGYACAVAFNAGNLLAVAKTLRAKFPDMKLIVCADDDYGTEGNLGITKATEAAQAVNGFLAIPDFGAQRPQGGTDFNDLHQHKGLDAVSVVIKGATVPASGEHQPDVEKTPPLLDKTVKTLAALTPLEYDQRRAEEATRLGVRLTTLDSEVTKARKALGRYTPDALVEELEVWPESVCGAEIATEIKKHLENHAVLPDGAATAITLWIMGTYCYDAFVIFPKLTISSPEKRCGKTTVLLLINAMSCRALPTSNISTAALFRVIDACRPTLLIDEADTFLAENVELKGVINSGHSRSSAFVLRVDGDNHEPKKFSTWAPMAIAMIKHPPETILDRSILVELRRRMPDEQVARLSLRLIDECLPLRQKLARWGVDHLKVLNKTEVDFPRCGNDRALDNWSSLLAIADSIGWREQVLASFRLLSVDDDEAIGPLLLQDIKEILDQKCRDSIHSTDLVEALVDLEERPWREWRRGKPITTNSLSRLLKPYGIKSKQLRIGTTNKNGYRRSEFEDAWSRYLCTPSSYTPEQNSTTLQCNTGAGYRPYQNSTSRANVEFKKPLKPLQDAGCRVVEVQNGVTGRGKDTQPPEALWQPAKGRDDETEVIL